jgi:transcriptional repressor NrdR
MRCPYCSDPDSRVTDSRTAENGIRRRRECVRCGLRFTTYERVQSTALVVAKRDGRREEFNREKLMAGVVKACAKRPVSFRDIEKLVEDIEAELQGLGHAEIRSTILGDMTIERLRKLDRVAYIRFASIYRDFQDIESFEEAVKDLRENTEQLTLMEGVPPAVQGRRGRRRGRVPTTPHVLGKDGHAGGNQHE